MKVCHKPQSLLVGLAALGIGYRFRNNLKVALTEIKSMGYAAKVRVRGDMAKLNFEWLNPPTLTAEMAQHQPTFVLHGAFGDSGNWIDFARSIEKMRIEKHLDPSSIGPVYILDFNGFEDGLAKLHAKIDEVMAQYKALGQQVSTPHFVGHSLGGPLALKEALICRQGWDPHFYLCASRCRIVGSVWRDWPHFLYADLENAIREVGTHLAGKPAPHIQIWSPSHDWLVPIEGQVLAGCTQHVVPGCSHLSILYAPQTHQGLIDALWPA